MCNLLNGSCLLPVILQHYSPTYAQVQESSTYWSLRFHSKKKMPGDGAQAKKFVTGTLSVINLGISFCFGPFGK